jgi:hypothetical protein
MIKPLMIALSLTAALSVIPAASALSLPAPISSMAYEPLYTEANWQTLRVPIAQLGGTLPSDLTLSASGLPAGTTVTLTGVTQEGAEAVLTLNVERADVSTAVNASSMITLTSGETALVSLSVPVIGTAISYAPVGE